jgi:serine/threonine protein kinase
MCFELLCSTTPFHSFKMADLISKINKGDYNLGLSEPVFLETALFLGQCLQANEEDRIDALELINHPFLNIAPLGDGDGFNPVAQILDKGSYFDELHKL